MPRPGSLIPASFYLRPVLEVARGLLGAHLRHGEVTLRITEVEAYGGPEDSASHCRSGRTPRNAPMWRSGGRAYVYFCYGMHHMLNVVAGPEGEGAAVLIRGCEPVEGLALIRQRRGGLEGPVLLAGPGKVAQALGLDRSYNDHLLYEAGGLEVRTGDPIPAVLQGPRVGIAYAEEAHRLLPWRFAVAGSLWVSQRKLLRTENPPDDHAGETG